MKKSVLVLGLIALFLTSCGEKKKEEVKAVQSEVETVEEKVEDVAKSNDELVAMGEKLFTDKTCTTCHQPDAKVIGPSIKDINKIYEEKNYVLPNHLFLTRKNSIDTVKQVIDF